VLLGSAIAYVAWRGYRRNDSRPMLVLSGRFGLALAAPFGLLLVFVAAGLSQGIVSVLSSASQVVGLSAIRYASWMPG
jgi:hypothetical protein